MAHLLIAAAHKSSGKTTISAGLAAALRTRGVTVQPFKKGPDYIDPQWLSLGAGRTCYNLDFFTMGTAEIQHVFTHRSIGADLSLIEGNKGLYDGLDLHGSNSNAALARLLASPVVLVIDARGMTRGIAPLILGYQAFDPEIHIAGVILNKLGGARHESKLRAVIEHYTDVPVVGAVHRHAGLAIVERHLGLTPCDECMDSLAQLRDIAERVGSEVDLDRIVAIADSAQSLKQPVRNSDRAVPTVARDITIGVPRDAAFGFYYPDDLEALERAGVKLRFFSPLADASLPEVDALFIGGGFPETNAQKLQANQSLRLQIKRFVEDQRPVYAECGGLMYLGKRLTANGRNFDMVGALPLNSVMMDAPVGRGYVRLTPTVRYPWGDLGDDLYAHEFHYARSEPTAGPLAFAYTVRRGYGFDGQHDGVVYKNTLASYVHLRSTDRCLWAARFVDFVRAYKRQPHVA